MAITMPAHRALSTKLAGRSFSTSIASRFGYNGYNPWIARVNIDHTDKSTSSQTAGTPSCRVYAIATRKYATATTSKASTTSTKAAGTKTTKSKSTTSAKGAKGAKTSKKKPASKKKPGRPKKKVVAKKTAKPKRRDTPTSLQAKAREEIKQLKEIALWGQDPHMLPETAWQIIFSESHPKGVLSGTTVLENSRRNTRDAAEKYKSLTPEERERYNHIGVANKHKNEQTHDKWISQYTPAQIERANNARHLLNRRREQFKKARDLKAYPWRRCNRILDDRRPKQPAASYARYSRDRHASGDFTGMKVTESAKLIGREWKALSAEERKPFEDSYKVDLARYLEEMQTVMGTEITRAKPRP